MNHFLKNSSSRHIPLLSILLPNPFPRGEGLRKCISLSYPLLSWEKGQEDEEVREGRLVKKIFQWNKPELLTNSNAHVNKYYIFAATIFKTG
jgi:hypothetical protein